MFSMLSALTLCLALSLVNASTLDRRARASVYSQCTVAKTVALTFDDGPYLYTIDIVNALNAAGAKGTFFVNRCIYDTAGVTNVKYAYDHGHQIASHTWAHKDLTTLSWDNIHDEMWRVEQALVRITGAYPAFMRPPFGNYNDLVLDASGVRGQSVVIWDFDSQDSLGATVATSKSLYASRISAKPNTILALNHETIETTAHQVLPYAIQTLQAAGYKLVTLAECLGKAPYQSVVAPSTRDSSWVC
ncbi:carbohydrate esterase family 4 protein [Hypholoma sublateritium FD-334 SS-4]|uniref:Carbohydrate esterase family 4 protein n=1 Tax=Hypholoma sublateritium (strain FD-334 SS-4) TaxID=945553 RepID=A0A0D2L2U0_HYPSF|nr:carbohydrate esterase family 4 protein [Hypholoma sublateritium FD-334 SS-4]